MLWTGIPLLGLNMAEKVEGIILHIGQRLWTIYQMYRGGNNGSMGVIERL